MAGGDLGGERARRGASCRRGSRACAWKVTASSAGSARGERLLAVLLPEEGRIREARTHHALVACAHLGRIAALDVADGDERGQQLAGRILHREVALVILERARSAPRAAATRKRSSKRPASATGHSTSAVTSSRSSSPISARPFEARVPSAVTSARMRSRRMREVREHVAALAQRALVGARRS